MKKLALSLIGLSILSVGIYSCTKEKANTNIKSTLKSTLNDLPPSETGEFYNYSVSFSEETPLFYMRKCKANKSEPGNYSEAFANELDLVFLFDNGVKLCSPNSESVNLLTNNDPNTNFTEIRTANISLEQFNEFYSQMDKNSIEEAFDNGTTRINELVQVNSILAVKTAQNEFGLVLIKNINGSTVLIDACHFKK